MKIGIIGAGQIGGTLTRRFSELGHDVAVANSRGPDTLSDLAKATGARPVTPQPRRNPPFGSYPATCGAPAAIRPSISAMT